MSAENGDGPQPVESVLPKYLFTERMVLELWDRANPDEHADFMLGFFNGKASIERMGDLGIRTREEHEALRKSCRINTVTRSGRRLNLDCPIAYMCRLGSKTGPLMGTVSLGQRGKGVPPDIGWGFVEAYYGKGYATEAATELLRYLTQDLDLSEIITWPITSNKASCRVAEKIGFVEGGRPEGAAHDSIVYILPPMEFDPTVKLSLWGDGDEN